MASWVRTITSPFRKACTIFNQQQPNTNRPDHKSHHHQRGTATGGHSEERTSTGRLKLHGEVMACGYEDVQVMWSILDMKSNPCTTTAALTS
ncbi:uncharacterized protein LOC130764539 [Actinidia eriantha]|uniref:uncharacterized protein LOC130764539 n=1 Tax=Actinidia eriantha TaxID=165200 RepID=UPI00258A42AE|nr:uncharacterized protein LOC130764539 [Actinidia eriantha]